MKSVKSMSTDKDKPLAQGRMIHVSMKRNNKYACLSVVLDFFNIVVDVDYQCSEYHRTLL